MEGGAVVFVLGGGEQVRHHHEGWRWEGVGRISKSRFHVALSLCLKGRATQVISGAGCGYVGNNRVSVTNSGCRFQTGRPPPLES